LRPLRSKISIENSIAPPLSPDIRSLFLQVPFPRFLKSPSLPLFRQRVPRHEKLRWYPANFTIGSRSEETHNTLLSFRETSPSLPLQSLTFFQPFQSRLGPRRGLFPLPSSSYFFFPPLVLSPPFDHFLKRLLCFFY